MKNYSPPHFFATQKQFHLPVFLDFRGKNTGAEVQIQDFLLIFVLFCPLKEILFVYLPRF